MNGIMLMWLSGNLSSDAMATAALAAMALIALASSAWGAARLIERFVHRIVWRKRKK